MQQGKGSSKGYYCENLTAIPLSVLARGFAQSLPSPMAYCLATWFRVRGLLRWYHRPLYAMGEAAEARTVTAEAVMPLASSKLAPYLEQLSDLEFNVIAHRLPDIIGAREQCVLLLLHANGTIVATLEWMRMPGADGPQQEVVLELNSYGNSDPEILTGCTNPAHLVFAEMLKLSFVDSSFTSNQKPIRTLLQTHQRRVGSRQMHRMNCESAQAEHLKRAKRRFDSLCKAGLIRKLSSREVTAVRSLRLDP